MHNDLMRTYFTKIILNAYHLTVNLSNNLNKSLAFAFTSIYRDTVNSYDFFVCFMSTPYFNFHVGAPDLRGRN